MVKIMENPIKMDDLGVPLFLETPMSHHAQTPPPWEEQPGRNAIFFSAGFDDQVQTYPFHTPFPSFLSKLSKQSFPTSQNEPFYPSPVSLIKTTPNSIQCQPRNLRSMLLVCIQFTTSGNKELTSLPTVIAWITW